MQVFLPRRSVFVIKHVLGCDSSPDQDSQLGEDHSQIFTLSFWWDARSKLESLCKIHLLEPSRLFYSHFRPHPTLKNSLEAPLKCCYPLWLQKLLFHVNRSRMSLQDQAVCPDVGVAVFSLMGPRKVIVLSGCPTFPCYEHKCDSFPAYYMLGLNWQFILLIFLCYYLNSHNNVVIFIKGSVGEAANLLVLIVKSGFLI